MAETYLVPGDGMYTPNPQGAGTLVNPGSLIVGVAGAYSVIGAHGPAVDTPNFALPASFTPAGLATLTDSDGRSRAKLWATEQNSYNVLRLQWPDAAITVQSGASVVRQP